MDFIIKVFGNPYMIIGIIVTILNFKWFARMMAGFGGGYWSGRRDKRADEPLDNGDYIGAAIWSFLTIPLWPMILLIRIWLKF